MNNGTYDEIQLNEENYYDNPRIIASDINEANKLEGSKSLTLRISMTTEKENLSPVIDLDRVSVITTSNRINQWPGGPQVLGLQSEIDTTSDVSLLNQGDQNDAVYLTKVAQLANVSRSIRLMISMQRYGDSNIDVYYRTRKPGSDKPIKRVVSSRFLYLMLDLLTSVRKNGKTLNTPLKVKSSKHSKSRL